MLGTALLETAMERCHSRSHKLRLLGAAVPDFALAVGTALLLAWALAMPGARPALAQAPQDQIVDSLDAYQHRVEGLITERLDSLIPHQNYVVRVNVNGHKVQVPRSGVAGAPGAALDLPGFRSSGGQNQLADEKYKVDQMQVRVVLNEQLRPEDLAYLRSIVPVLADFRPDRGDRLDLQMLPAFGGLPAGQTAQSLAANPPGAAAPSGQAGAPTAATSTPTPSGQPGAQQGNLAALTPMEWALVALLGLILLVLLVVLVRLLFLPKAQQMPQYQPQYQPPMPRYQPPMQMPSPQPELQQAMAPQMAMQAPMAAGRPGQDPRKLQEEERKDQEQERYYETLRSAVVKGFFARSDLGRSLVQSWQGDQGKLSILIHAMGTQVARQALLGPLGVARYADMEEAVRDEDPPEREKQIGVLREANLYLLSQELEHPEEIKADPFGFLTDLSRGQVGHLIKPEPVKVKAIVLSRIKSEDTAQIMEELPKDMQLEIAVNIGNLQSLPLDMVESVAMDLAEKARHLPDSRSVDIEGPKTLIDMMGRTSPSTSLYLLQAMKSKDRKLADAVEQRFFVFDAIPLVPDEVLPQIVRGMPSAVVVQALQGAPQDLQRKVIMAFPEQARGGMVTSLRAAKADAATVEEARRTLVARFQAVAQQGKLDLKQISAAWQAQAKAS